MWEVSDHAQSVFPLNWGASRTVSCMVLKAPANDRRRLALCHDEFRGPRSGLCRLGGISNNNKTNIEKSVYLLDETKQMGCRSFFAECRRKQRTDGCDRTRLVA
ncbi:uncharacterized protein TNCV_3652461 [Trichonephila clavipes]|nr:uncharacterized protein TNCV_3652461 [Trichonephila clavipes]